MRAHALVRRGPGGGAGSERITVNAIPLRDAPDWLRDREAAGTLVDPKSGPDSGCATR